MTDLTTHPMPWSDRNNWVHLQGNGPGRDERPVALTIGRHDGTAASLGYEELTELRDRLNQILVAPYRMYVVGGDCVDAARDWPAIYEWLDKRHSEVVEAGWHLQIVTGPENPAQALVYVWALNRNIETIGVRPVRFDAGGSAVAMMPTRHGLDILRSAHGDHDLPVYRMPPHELWGGGRA